MIPSEETFFSYSCFGNAHVNDPAGKLSPQLSTEFELKKVLFGAPFGAPLEPKSSEFSVLFCKGACYGLLH